MTAAATLDTFGLPRETERSVYVCVEALVSRLAAELCAFSSHSFGGDCFFLPRGIGWLPRDFSVSRLVVVLLFFSFCFWNSKRTLSKDLKFLKSNFHNLHSDRKT